MQSSSVPLPAQPRERVASPSGQQPRYRIAAQPTGGSVGPVASSWESVHNSLSRGRSDPPLAWAGVRHQEVTKELQPQVEIVKEQSSRDCNQAVLLTCLHLSHLTTLRDVGMYAWTLPMMKDHAESTMRIMKQYAQQLRDLSTHVSLNVRLAPDPSKTSIQHHLQKARLAAGPDGYVAVLYAGHGIQEPPTEPGELWCYNRSFEECAQTGEGPSEYIPVLLFDMFTWAGASTCYVWDSQNAGRFIRAALTESQEIDTQLRSAAAQNPSVAAIHPAVYAKRHIHFAACGANEPLPRIPGFPDDLFTSCLTTPLRIALLYHNLQTSPLVGDDSEKQRQRTGGYMDALLESISDKLFSRLWSELRAILYTIAWQTLDGPTYQMLFVSSGEVVANLSAGYLLAQRVLKTYRTHPESIPHIPASTEHSLWTTWDLILDNLFEQLPPQFDEDGDVTAWEDKVTLVSFMNDQLASILECDRPLFTADVPKYKPGIGGVGVGGSKGLLRLPIICQAALLPEFRVRACAALDACLREVDMKGLAQAVQGGALDVATQLFDTDNDALGGMMVSVWASLVRHDACVALLCASGLTAERLTSVPSVRFFLETLERQMEESAPDAKRSITQTTAVLATVANYVAGRQAPRFVKRTLELGRKMMSQDESLIKQWGALLVAEVLLNIAHQDDQLADVSDSLQRQLLEMVDSTSVEERATAVCALSRWIKNGTHDDIVEMEPELNLLSKVIDHARTDGSGLVRKEIVHLLQRALTAGGRWTKLVLWTYIVDRASQNLIEVQSDLAASVAEVKAHIEVGDERKKCLRQLMAVIKVYELLLNDSNAKVRELVESYVADLFDGLRPFIQATMLDAIKQATFPPRGEADTARDAWTQELAAEARSIGSRLAMAWNTNKPEAPTQGAKNELFEKSKLSLQAYLAREEVPRKSLEQLAGKPESATDKNHQMRFRFLEDSLVLAEQQVGLPWKWEMKNISSPDPWTCFTFHSFLNTVMSCNHTQDLLMWDWSTSRKTGTVKLQLGGGSVITNARFVNELFERVVVLAEINNGDIHVLSATADDPINMKPISSFLALDMRNPTSDIPATDRKLVTTWWRQSGKLCVGGPSTIVNIWDCPAERLDRTLETDSNTAVASLITEPVSGNLILGGFADGMVKLWDLRENRKRPLMSWKADTPGAEERQRLIDPGSHGVAKLGVVLGESRHVTTACSNGLLRVHDLRQTASPTSSIVAHHSGISSASFQAHSGLMSTTAQLAVPAFEGTVDVNWGLYRSTRSVLSTVTENTFTLENPLPTLAPDADRSNQQQRRDRMSSFAPYTVMHNLRPFLGVGYGTESVLRGVGRGTGDDAESGSYTFLRSQLAMGDDICM